MYRSLPPPPFFFALYLFTICSKLETGKREICWTEIRKQPFNPPLSFLRQIKPERREALLPPFFFAKYRANMSTCPSRFFRRILLPIVSSFVPFCLGSLFSTISLRLFPGPSLLLIFPLILDSTSPRPVSSILCAFVLSLPLGFLSFRRFLRPAPAVPRSAPAPYFSVDSR